MEKKTRITTVTAFFMVALAAFFDLAQFLIGAGSVALAATAVGAPIGFVAYFVGYGLTIYANLIFFIWFWTKGVSFRSVSRAATGIVEIILESIPGEKDLVPALTLAIIVIIVLVMAEDRGFDATKIAVKGAVSGGAGAGTEFATQAVGSITGSAGVQGIKTS